MDVINIFLTSELGESLEDFVHDQRRFTFDRLGPEGPRRLVEGPMWAFVDWVMGRSGGPRNVAAGCAPIPPHRRCPCLTMVLEEDDRYAPPPRAEGRGG